MELDLIFQYALLLIQFLLGLEGVLLIYFFFHDQIYQLVKENYFSKHTKKEILKEETHFMITHLVIQVHDK